MKELGGGGVWEEAALCVHISGSVSVFAWPGSPRVRPPPPDHLGFVRFLPLRLLPSTFPAFRSVKLVALTQRIHRWKPGSVPAPACAPVKGK